MRITRLRITDPGLSSLKSAARAAIIMPAVFALSFKVIQNQQTAIFSAFGSFAMLVFVDFRGPPRSRLTAYLSLAAAGAVLIIIGTLCGQNPWLAGTAMAVVGFVILSSGVINGYFAAATTSAALLFVLPVAIRVPVSDIPDRLAGWGLAAGAGILALALLWPPRLGATLRGNAAAACLALADLADVVYSPDKQAVEARGQAAAQACATLRKRYAAALHRPTGPSSQAAALAALTDELTWLSGWLRAAADTPETTLCSAENSTSMAAVAAALRASGGVLAGRDEHPDTRRLEAAQDSVVRALVRAVSEHSRIPDDAMLESLLSRSFRSRAISYAASQIVIYALAATGTRRVRRTEPALPAIRQYITEHVGLGSVALRNSVRGAAGLAVAVFIAQESGLQHSFWVVLGTLSVLRSNALGTGRSILGALAGTAVGIVVGALIIVGLGAGDSVLWGVLPVAMLFAAYAPRAISFAVGQAAFTIVLVVLYNIIAPVGWQVGLVRIEDVAIGFGVSLGVGLLFWPRGAAAVLRRNLDAAYSRSADYVAVTARALTGGGTAADEHRAEQTATVAVHQLDDAYRQYLAERSAKRADPESAAGLVAGAARVLRIGHSMESLAAQAAATVPDGSLGRYAGTLDGQVQDVRSWYVTLGGALAHGTPVPPPQASQDGRGGLLQEVRDVIGQGDQAALRRALLALWATQHLDVLRGMEAHLGSAAGAAVTGSGPALAAGSQVPGRHRGR